MAFKELEEFRAKRADADAAPDERPAILIVDDDAGLRAALEIVLRRLYRVHVCASGAEGVQALDDGDIFAVILDIKMAGTDGFSTFTQMREKDPDLPIIFHSAYQDLKDPYKIMNEYRPYGYIMKGSDFGELFRVVADAVTHYERITRRRNVTSEIAQLRAQMDELRRGSKG